MKVLVFPVQDFVCANCGLYMLCEPIGVIPTKERIICCVNNNCEMVGKKAKISAIELEVEEQ